MKTIALLGCGALAHVFSDHFCQLPQGAYQITHACAKTLEHAQSIAQAHPGCVATDSIDTIVAAKPDLVVEFAGIGAVQEHAQAILKAGISFVMVSVGALADARFKALLQETARDNHCDLYVANGAIGGFDLMQTFSLMGLDQVSITSTKSPRSLNGAPYLKGRVLSEQTDETVFTGSVTDAIAGFPKNVNVAVATACASNFANTKVRVISQATSKVNSHSIELVGQHVKAHICIASTPDPKNPKSSTSTAFSVLALLKNLAGSIHYF